MCNQYVLLNVVTQCWLNGVTIDLDVSSMLLDLYLMFYSLFIYNIFLLLIEYSFQILQLFGWLKKSALNLLQYSESIA